MDSQINQFFEQPILNSPNERPLRHWQLDETGQPTQRIEEFRRPAQFILAKIQYLIASTSTVAMSP